MKVRQATLRPVMCRTLVLWVWLTLAPGIDAAPRPLAAADWAGTPQWDRALPWFQRAWAAAQDIGPPDARWRGMRMAATAIAIGGSPEEVHALSRSITKARRAGRINRPQAQLLLGFCHLVLNQRQALEAVYDDLKPHRPLANQLESAAACWFAEQGDRSEMNRWKHRRLEHETKVHADHWRRHVLARHEPRRRDPEAPLRRMQTIGGCVQDALAHLAGHPAVPQHRIDQLLLQHEERCHSSRPDWETRARIAQQIVRRDFAKALTYVPADPGHSRGFYTHHNLFLWLRAGRTDLSVRTVELIEHPGIRADWAIRLLIKLDPEAFNRYQPRLLPLSQPLAKTEPHFVAPFARLIGSRFALDRPDQAQRVIDHFPYLAKHPYTLARRHAHANDWEALKQLINNQPDKNDRQRVLAQAIDSATPPAGWLLDIAPALRSHHAASHIRNIGLQAAQRGNAPLARQALRTWQAVVPRPITDDPNGYRLAYLIAIRYHLDGPAAAVALLERFPSRGSVSIVAGPRFARAKQQQLWQLLIHPQARFHFAIGRADSYLPIRSGLTVGF